MLGFKFNGKHSYFDLGVIAKSINRGLLPGKIKRDLSIPGKHGTYDFGGNVFEKRIITVGIQYSGGSFFGLRTKARELAAWLSQTEECQLIFDDESDKYYMAKIYNQIDFESFFKLGKITVNFECQPFAQSVFTSDDDLYLDDNIPLDYDVWLGTDFSFLLNTPNKVVTVANIGNYELGLDSQEGASFKILVTGTFTIFSISMNGKTLTYSENCINQTITIDNAKGTVKNGLVNKLFNTNTVDFLKLLPGDNLITISKTGGDLIFKFDFRPQFI